MQAATIHNRMRTKSIDLRRILQRAEDVLPSLVVRHELQAVDGAGGLAGRDDREGDRSQSRSRSWASSRPMKTVGMPPLIVVFFVSPTTSHSRRSS